MHYLPLGAMNRQLGEQIGCSIGEVVEVDVHESNEAWGQCLRVRVKCELMKALGSGRTMTFNGEKMWILLKESTFSKVLILGPPSLRGEPPAAGKEELVGGLFLVSLCICYNA